MASTVPVVISIESLDGTTARSVQAFVETKLRDQATIASRAAASVVLIDLDRPGAAVELAAARPDQRTVGIGFGASSGEATCDIYVQKPLTGAALTDVVRQAVPATPTAPPPPQRPSRFSHARDVIVTGRRYDGPRARPRPATDWGATPHVRLDRSVHTRSANLADTAVGDGSAAAAAEALGRTATVEPIPAHDGGDVRDPAVAAACTYDRARHLDGELLAIAGAHPSTAWRLHNAFVSCTFDPTDGSVTVDANDTVLRRLCAEPTDGTWTAEVLRRPDVAAPGRRLPLEVLAWNLAVWSSGGRLAAGLDPCAPFAAAGWPDLTRGVLTPSALAIVALLAAGPHRPVDVPDKLGVSRSHVFVVCSALDAVGLLAPFDGMVPTTPPAALHPNGTGSAATGTAGTTSGTTSVTYPERRVLRRLLGRLLDR